MWPETSQNLITQLLIKVHIFKTVLNQKKHCIFVNLVASLLF